MENCHKKEKCRKNITQKAARKILRISLENIAIRNEKTVFQARG